MTDTVVSMADTPGIILGVGEWATGATSVDMGEEGIVGMVSFHAVKPGNYVTGSDVEPDSLVDKNKVDFLLAFATIESIDVLADYLQLVRLSMVNKTPLSTE